MNNDVNVLKEELQKFKASVDGFEYRSKRSGVILIALNVIYLAFSLHALSAIDWISHPLAFTFRLVFSIFVAFLIRVIVQITRKSIDFAHEIGLSGEESAALLNAFTESQKNQETEEEQ